MQFEVGMICEGKVSGITKFGAFVELEGGKTGMVHISEIAPTFVNEIRDFVTEGQTVKVKILSIGEDGKISLSMKKALPAPSPESGARPPRRNTRPPRRTPAPIVNNPNGYEWTPRTNESASFEDMMQRYKQSSEEKMSDIKRGVDSKRGGFSRRGSRKDF